MNCEQAEAYLADARSLLREMRMRRGADAEHQRLWTLVCGAEHALKNNGVQNDNLSLVCRHAEEREEVIA